MFLLYANSILDPSVLVLAIDRPLPGALFSFMHPNFITLKYTFPTISETGDFFSFKHLEEFIITVTMRSKERKKLLTKTNQTEVKSIKYLLGV